MRIVLAICAVVGSALCGRSLAGAARRRAALLASLEEGLKALRVCMTTMFEPLRDALSRSPCRLLALIGAEMGGGTSAMQAWERVARQQRRSGGMIDALSDADIDLLNRLFAGLGLSGRDSQEVLLAGCVRAISEARQEAAAMAREVDRLYVSLGLLIGLMLALIVI